MDFARNAEYKTKQNQDCSCSSFTGIFTLLCCSNFSGKIKMNKILKSIIVVMAVASTLLTVSCNKTVNSDKKSIVCTTFPEYDWVMNIVGEKASGFDVTLLQNKGTDLHSYQPSVQDIAKISEADLFVYVGGESDEWVEKVLSRAANKNQIVVNMMEVIGDKVREEEIVEGMQAEESEENRHHDEEESEYDEHVWLSIRNAIDISKVLCVEICKIDGANSSVYTKNLEAYTKQLDELDAEYKAVVKSAKKNTVLFGDRYPFRYLTDEYDLKYFAAFVGCSAESEASFETVVFLANKVDELGLNVVLTIEKSDKKIAKTIVSSTQNKNQQILEMDSLQSITQAEIKNGRNYLSTMKNNLEVLKKALN